MAKVTELVGLYAIEGSTVEISTPGLHAKLKIKKVCHYPIGPSTLLSSKMGVGFVLDHSVFRAEVVEGSLVLCPLHGSEPAHFLDIAVTSVTIVPV